jgi:hypothetical protein
MSEQVLNLGEDAAVQKSFVAGQPAVTRTTDPVILPQPYASPADFAAQYPTPLDTTEILDMCEEISVLRAIPTVPTALQAYTWREMTSLAFTSGSAYIAFADGECPEEYTHDGANQTVNIKYIGAKKTLSVSDIKHSMAVAGANWNGINQIVGGFPSSEGVPGGIDSATFARERIRDVKEKEVRLAMTLVMNGWDRLLVLGDTNTNALEFDGIEQWPTNMSVTFHTNSNTASGTFSATSFDRWLAESCAKPTHIFGHPAAVQEMLSSYFVLGFQGSQAISFSDGNRLTPGFNFASFVNTGVGRLQVVSDYNFTRTNILGGAFQSKLWAFRMTHNGEPLVYQITQFPLSYQDLTPGCTAISFEVWAATALVVKAACSHGTYTAQFTGNISATCSRVG